MRRPRGTVASGLPTSSWAASLGCGEFGVEGFREMDTARQRLFRFDDERAAYRAASAIRDLNDSAVWDVKVVVQDGGALLHLPEDLWVRRREIAAIVAQHRGRPA
jgi:hypothetical protein